MYGISLFGVRCRSICSTTRRSSHLGLGDQCSCGRRGPIADVTDGHGLFFLLPPTCPCAATCDRHLRSQTLFTGCFAAAHGQQLCPYNSVPTPPTWPHGHALTLTIMPPCSLAACPHCGRLFLSLANRARAASGKWSSSSISDATNQFESSMAIHIHGETCGPRTRVGASLLAGTCPVLVGFDSGSMSTWAASRGANASEERRKPSTFSTGKLVGQSCRFQEPVHPPVCQSGLLNDRWTSPPPLPPLLSPVFFRAMSSASSHVMPTNFFLLK